MVRVITGPRSIPGSLFGKREHAAKNDRIAGKIVAKSCSDGGVLYSRVSKGTSFTFPLETQHALAFNKLPDLLQTQACTA